VRDLDGVTRRVERWGSSQSAARRALQDELRTRSGERPELLRLDSRFRDASDVWMSKIRERREDSTLDIYQHWLKKVVLPQLGELRLAECDVAQIDAFFSRLERMRRTVLRDDGTTSEKPHYAASSRRTVRAVVSGILQQAVSCTRPYRPTQFASWSASSRPRGTARRGRAVSRPRSAASFWRTSTRTRSPSRPTFQT
jgi:hypothetical protein